MVEGKIGMIPEEACAGGLGAGGFASRMLPEAFWSLEVRFGWLMLCRAGTHPCGMCYGKYVWGSGSVYMKKSSDSKEEKEERVGKLETETATAKCTNSGQIKMGVKG